MKFPSATSQPRGQRWTPADEPFSPLGAGLAVSVLLGGVLCGSGHPRLAEFGDVPRPALSRTILEVLVHFDEGVSVARRRLRAVASQSLPRQLIQVHLKSLITKEHLFVFGHAVLFRLEGVSPSGWLKSQEALPSPDVDVVVAEPWVFLHRGTPSWWWSQQPELVRGVVGRAA